MSFVTRRIQNFLFLRPSLKILGKICVLLESNVPLKVYRGLVMRGLEFICLFDYLLDNQDPGVFESEASAKDLSAFSLFLTDLL